MANKRLLAGTYQKVLSGQGTISFRDFFAFKGQKGSHRIYFHPSVGRPFPFSQMARKRSGIKFANFAI
ncbi:MAG: hypothetical protein V7604_2658 [Hyphomicrobiales bacterium]|jgi:hypothetical protein